MNPQNGYYPYYDQNQYNNGYNNNMNYNYDQYQNNNNYNQYGNINYYYNNNPVYSVVPPSNPSQNYSKEENKEIKVTNENKNETKNTKLKKGIMLNIKKENMCYLRPPEYQPGYIKQTYGVPQYAQNPPK